jgi:Ca2+:H+ antiporter
VPAVAAVSIALGQPLALGLGPKEVVLLALTLLLAVITLGTGRTTVLQGIVHLAVFAAFVFLAWCREDQPAGVGRPDARSRLLQSR